MKFFVFLFNEPAAYSFKTTVGVDQACLLSPILFNLFLKKTMQETLQDNHKSFSIGGRPICNPRFADDITLMGSSNGEFQDLTYRLVEKTEKTAQKRPRS